MNIAGFCTGTWLLDAEFRKIFPPDSNIVQFGRLFHLLSATDANDRQLRERVFNNAEWQDCAATNSLQRTVLEYHNNGGEFRVTAGYILLQEVEKRRDEKML